VGGQDKRKMSDAKVEILYLLPAAGAATENSGLAF